MVKEYAYGLVPGVLIEDNSWVHRYNLPTWELSTSSQSTLETWSQNKLRKNESNRYYKDRLFETAHSNAYTYIGWLECVLKYLQGWYLQLIFYFSEGDII